MRWTDSQGAWNTLAESELRWELSTTPRLLPILRDLPPVARQALPLSPQPHVQSSSKSSPSPSP